MQILVMDKTGDTPHEFGLDQMEDAKKLFNDLMADGKHFAFTVDEHHNGTKVNTFDPNVDRYIISPYIVGG